MSNGKGVDQNNHNSDTELQGVYRAVVDALIITIGDAISAVSTILELEEDKEQTDKIDDLKNLIQHVTNLTEKVKNLNHQNYKCKDID